MSDILDLDDELKAAGASCLRHGEEIERLTEENLRLAERVKELEGNKAELEDNNKSLREEVERSDITKGALSSQVEELTVKLQDSSRYSALYFIHCLFYGMFFS